MGRQAPLGVGSPPIDCVMLYLLALHARCSVSRLGGGQVGGDGDRLLFFFFSCGNIFGGGGLGNIGGREWVAPLSLHASARQAEGVAHCCRDGTIVQGWRWQVLQVHTV